MTHRRNLTISLVPLLLVASLVVAGSGPAGAWHEPEYFPLDVLPAPDTTGERIVDDLVEFVDAHPLRITGTPVELAAAQHLHDRFESFGYEASIQDLPPVNNAPATAPVLRAVNGFKRGTTMPDEWIMLVGHYDTIATTVYGAYDNGAGTNMIVQLADALQDVPTNRSIMFTLYNGEEEGVLASQRHATLLAAAEQEITAVLGFDMVGIAWPVATVETHSCLCMFHGPGDEPWARPLLEHVNFDFLGYENAITSVWIQGQNTRNSDERSFARQGYRTLRWAGKRTASSYRAYHLPDDTMETIYAEAGGRSFFEQGSMNTLTSAYYTALSLDNHLPQPAFSHSSDGRTVTFDATASGDDDGPLTSFTWDFGDGSTGSGSDPTHTFAAAGTYMVTLTVADNTWDEVTRTLQVPVTVG